MGDALAEAVAERFEPTLLNMAQQIAQMTGGQADAINTLLDLYFGFLRRKTDFFRPASISCPWAGPRGGDRALTPPRIPQRRPQGQEGGARGAEAPNGHS
jgi:hypothetical protein